jgi:hypothetical protein
MTDTDPPPVIDRHEPPAEPRRTGPLGSIEGADQAALGLSGEAESAPPGAAVDASETDLPGTDFGDFPATDAKPWQTTLASKSDHADMGSEPDPEGEI